MPSTRLTLAVLFGLVAAPALAQDVQYQLVNDSGLTLMEFYATPTDGGEADDLLGANVIAAGSNGTVSLANGGALCTYDLRFVFEDGSELTDSVNVCETPSYTVTP